MEGCEEYKKLITAESKTVCITSCSLATGTCVQSWRTLYAAHFTKYRSHRTAEYVCSVCWPRVNAEHKGNLPQNHRYHISENVMFICMWNHLSFFHTSKSSQEWWNKYMSLYINLWTDMVSGILPAVLSGLVGSSSLCYCQCTDLSCVVMYKSTSLQM